MNNRQRVNAILHYQPYDRMPVASFGYWEETLGKWAAEGHICREDAEEYRQKGDGSPADQRIMARLGFDINWGGAQGGCTGLFPPL